MKYDLHQARLHAQPVYQYFVVIVRVYSHSISLKKRRARDGKIHIAHTHSYNIYKACAEAIDCLY